MNTFSVFSWLSIPAAGTVAGLSSLTATLLLGGWSAPIAAGFGAMAGSALCIGLGALFSRERKPAAAPVLTREEADLLKELSASQQRHYESLRALKDRTLQSYARLPGGKQLQLSSQRHLHALLVAFLRLVVALNLYRHCFRPEEKKTIEEELKEVLKSIAEEGGSRLAEIKKRRADILEKRLARFTYAEESREWMSHQLASIEDLLRLTNEQSVSMRDPESVNRQLELLTQQAVSTEETVREMERFMEFSEELTHWNTQKAGIRQ